MNALSHTAHLYGVSLVCVLKCRFRSPRYLNTLSHTLHLNSYLALLGSLFKFCWNDFALSPTDTDTDVGVDASCDAATDVAAINQLSGADSNSPHGGDRC